MTFWQGLKDTYRGGGAFLVACPLLALVPVAAELIQHGVEVHIGMYRSMAAAQAVEHHPLRMGFGFAKVVALTLPLYWVARFLAWRSPALAGRFERRAATAFAGFLLFQMAMIALQMFVLPTSVGVVLAGFLLGQVVTVLTAAWGVAAALGNVAVGPAASVRTMGRRLPWTYAFLFVAILPPMLLHYVLGALALVGPKPLLWPILVADSFLVGWLCAVMAASLYVAARRAADLAGIAMIPPRPADRRTPMAQTAAAAS